MRGHRHRRDWPAALEALRRLRADKEGTSQVYAVMLATHGVLGLSNCFPEPALLASLGDKVDGLIEASQLLDRDLRVQLVVLSACDTAAGGKLDGPRRPGRRR